MKFSRKSILLYFVTYVFHAIANLTNCVEVLTFAYFVMHDKIVNVTYGNILLCPTFTFCMGPVDNFYIRYTRK